MAVIDTSMDFPMNCHECKNQNCVKSRIPWVTRTKDYRTDRHSDCPLKSVDGLAEAIEQFPFTYGHASYINRAINEYCGKEN